MSRSGYCRKPKAPEREEIELEKAVIHCFEKHHENYGRIRIRKTLQAEEIQISESKIARILREHGLKAKTGRTGRSRKTKSKETAYIEENLKKDKFSATEPNALWCSDITELKCRDGKLYVCGIIDVGTRRIVGWSVARTQTQNIVQNAFKMAVGEIPTARRMLFFTVTEAANIQLKVQRVLLK